ncbi:leucyl aminopeptidase [Prochlorococcus marinus]|uniref:Probable cytosol aminopeptidase n=1 Tax=Prochlorococcus marinus XMU1408 TaxID=2213228 RepID=A0A318QYZ1_PROMR|nr:leucyl aminopeptidase [Prochlorococcus marinus]MBW3042516.1 leucyl aminopeptidase [Prochlorococcus marinus str. XMU1408]PYE01244.1 leucyl aminopeptidase [Prochlorococcus marinus XMU1408]
MQISAVSKEINEWSGSVLIAGILEGTIESQINLFNSIIKDTFLSQRFNDSKFEGKKNQRLSIELIEGKIKKVIFIGLGKAETLRIDDLRKAASIGSRQVLSYEKKLGIFFPWDAFDPSSAACAVGEAVQLSSTKDLRFKSESKEPTQIDEVELIGLNSKTTKSAIAEINPICEGVKFARELVSAPPNVLTPYQMAKEAEKLATDYDLDLKILDKKECEERGMGAYLAVAKGSDLEPNFIHLKYSPKTVRNKVVLVGKGLTFDSGGYNLKVGASQIEKMKYDMGGSASVLGTARAIAELKPSDTEVHFIIAACENMINGSALHPGDIIKASNGKTIEVNNTDAEGRLTLADALVYACKLDPDAIVDLATLTGACVIALGDEIAGLWTDNDLLSEQLTKAAGKAGEGIWRMPMQNSYKSGIKSSIADLQNTGPRPGGSITAALFLKEFVNSSIPWAHIDIAGTCWTEKDRDLNPKGATGYGVRTLVNWIKELNMDNN